MTLSNTLIALFVNPLDWTTYQIIWVLFFLVICREFVWETHLLSIRFEDFKRFLHDSDNLHVHGLQFLCCVISVFGLEETLEQIVQKNPQIRLIIRNKKFL